MENEVTDPSLQNLIDNVLGKQSQPVAQMTVRVADTINVKVEQLRKLVAQNPNHPKSQVFAAATANHMGGDTVAVEKVDLEAIIKNKQVTHVVVNERMTDANGNEELVPVEKKYIDP